MYPASDSGKTVIRKLPALVVLFSLPLALLVAVADPVGLTHQSYNPEFIGVVHSPNG
jgi:hypothetical protein